MISLHLNSDLISTYFSFNHYVYYPYFTPCLFFIPVLIGDLSLESNWQHVSSRFRNYSDYSSRSRHCCGLASSSDFRLLRSLSQAIVSISLRANCNCYDHHLHVPQPFPFSCKMQVFLSFRLFFIFILWTIETAKSIRWQVLFSSQLTLDLDLWIGLDY